MYTIKYQNNSGNWFESNCPDVSSAEVVYNWKKTGGVAVKVEMWLDGKMIQFWER